MTSLADEFADLIAPGNSPEIRPHSPRVRPAENGANAGVSPNSPVSPEDTAPSHSPGPDIDFELIDERAAIMEFDGGIPRPEAEARAFEEWRARHALGEVRLLQLPAVTLAELRRRYPGIKEAWPEGDSGRRPGAERWPGIRMAATGSGAQSQSRRVFRADS